MATKTKSAKELRNYNRLIKTLDRIESGRWSELTVFDEVHWCSDYTLWLYKWGKITKEEMNNLCERITAIWELI
jgi:hypothetical protein